MAEASAVRDRAGDLVSRGADTAKRSGSRGPTLASIVAQWQQSIGNSGMAQLGEMSEGTAEPGASTDEGGPLATNGLPADSQTGVNKGTPPAARSDGATAEGEPATETSGRAEGVPRGALGGPLEESSGRADASEVSAGVAEGQGQGGVSGPVEGRSAGPFGRLVEQVPPASPSRSDAAPSPEPATGQVPTRSTKHAPPGSGSVDAPPMDGVGHLPAPPDTKPGPGKAAKHADASQTDGLTKPGFVEKGAAHKGKPQRKAPKGSPATGGGTTMRRVGGGGGGGGGAKPGLGDPTLDRWKSAVAAGTSAVKSGDLGDVKKASGDVAKKGADVSSTRKAAQTDPVQEAKAKQPPLPKEEPKQKTLNTSEADTAVTSVETAGKKKLTDQSFSSFTGPPAYQGAPLTGGDFVPRTFRTAQAELEAELAKTTDKTKIAELTKQLDSLKKRIATIEASGGKGPAPELPKAIHDEGAATLTPPNPAMGSILGDAIARAMQQVGPKSNQIVDDAVGAVHGKLVPKMVAMGKTEQPTLEQELRTELTGIATAAGVSQEQLDAKVKEQQDVVAKQIEEAKTGIHTEATKAAGDRQEQAKLEGESAGGAKLAVQQEIDAKQAAAEGPPDTEAIEAKRDELLGKLESTGGTALAALRASLEKRNADLDAGSTEKKAKINQAAKTQADAIRRHWANDTDPNKGMVEARPTADWGVAEAARVDGELKRLKAAASAEHESFATGVANQLQPSRDRIRDWAAHQEGRERSWWERLIDMFRDWGKQATSTNEAWEKQRNAESRDAMAHDLDQLAELKRVKLEQGDQAYEAELAKLSKDQQELIKKYMSGGTDSIGYVADSTMMRIAKRRKPELAKKFEERAIAEWDGEALGELARQTNPKFNPRELANKVHGGVAGWGTNEAKVYEGLGGARTPVERAALDKSYRDMFNGASMTDDIHDDMDEGKERDRADALMSGDTAKADAATIAEAVSGLGTDEKAIRDALRGKTPEELEAIKAVYKEKYGVDLTTDLRGDMEGAELDNALALADGDTDKADAAELEDAMSGPGTDEDKMKQVYERIRDEEQRYAISHGLTKAELDKRIKDRNARVSTRYASMGYGDLTKNAKDELSDGDPLSENNADNKLFAALQEGDESKADAAKALIERQGVYTSDDEVEKIVRNQRTKAEFEVNLEDAGEKARLVASVNAGDITKAEFDTKMAAFDPRNKDNEKSKDDRVQAKGRANVAALKSNYEGMANTDVSIALHGKDTFDKLVEEGTSGYSTYEIRDLMKAGGKLSPEQEIYYAVAGAGTDEDKIKETLKDKTPAQIQEIRVAYERLHGPGSFDSDILGDLSGREDLDVGLSLKYGDPSTFAEQLDAVKDPDKELKRKQLLDGFENYLKKRRDFERSGQIGGAMALFGDSMNSEEQLEQAIQRAKQYDAALGLAEADPNYDPNKKDEDPNLVSAKARFDMNFAGAVQAQEEVREQIDAVADIASQIGAAAVGIAVTVLSAGTAGPLVIALYAATASALTSIAMKMSLKGAAYGWEDLGIDLATGVIDVGVTVATAGVGKAVVASVERAIASQAAKMAAREGAEELTESAVKAFIRDALEEGIENGIQAMPSAFAGNVLNGQDPLTAVKGAGMAGVQGAGMGMGIHTVKTGGGAVLKGIKGMLKSEPHIETTTPQSGHTSSSDPASSVGDDGGGTAPPTAPSSEIDTPGSGEPHAGGPAGLDGTVPTEPHVDPGKVDAGTPAEAHQTAGTHESGGTARSISAKEGDAAAGTAKESTTSEATGSSAKSADQQGPSHDDVGKQLSDEDLAKRYGMPKENVDKIKALCAQEKIIIDVRPTTPHAEPMLREGTALPKPEKLKAKTINELDVMLGLAGKENLGKVGFFEPQKMRLPDDIDQLHSDLQADLKKRMKQRQEEFADFKGDMEKLVQDGKIRIEADGTVTNTGLLKGQGELPFTGDHDLFDIRHADGTALTPGEYKAIKQKLMEADAGIMHGAVTGWGTDSPSTFNTEAGQKSYNKMVADHTEGGKEPLVRFGEGEPKGVWHEPATPRTELFSDSEIDNMLADVKETPTVPKAGSVTDAEVKTTSGGDESHGPHVDAEVEIHEVPEGTIYFSEGVAATDAAANLEYFKKVAALEPHLEIALMRNTETGEFLVMQGNGGAVPIGESASMAAGALKPGGHWVIEAHNHPVDATGVTPAYNRLPSGATGDMRAVVRESIATGQPRTSEIHIVTEKGPDVTRFGFDPAHPQPYMIDFPDVDGSRVVKRFATIEEYHGWYASQYGKVATLGEIPSDFEGPRFKPGSSQTAATTSDSNTGFDEEPPTNPGRATPVSPSKPKGPDVDEGTVVKGNSKLTEEEMWALHEQEMKRQADAAAAADDLDTQEKLIDDIAQKVWENPEHRADLVAQGIATAEDAADFAAAIQKQENEWVRVGDGRQASAFVDGKSGFVLVVDSTDGDGLGTLFPPDVGPEAWLLSRGFAKVKK